MTNTNWQQIKLYGAGAIAKVCAIYEVFDLRIPGTRFKVKVLQRGPSEYMATLNVCLKSADGAPDWIAGLGGTEEEAVEDALKWFMSALDERKTVEEEDFEWSDPIDF